MSTAAESSSSSSILKWANEKGEFIRKPSTFRNWIKKGDTDGFPPETDRYHLYVSYACPWAHRTLIVRKLKGLEGVISFDVVDYLIGEKGWAFSPSKPGCTQDTVNGFSFLRDVYCLSDSNFEGRVTVPVLFDKKKKEIVNNESSEIIRMFNSEFSEFSSSPEQATLDLYPTELQKEIDSLNEWIYTDINNGVYKAGFATKQEAYDKAVTELFAGLDKLEALLSQRRYLTGPRLTEADVRLYTTLVRFDCVYVGHFKCNKKRIVDYPNLWGYLRDLYQTPGFGDTTNRFHIEHHYQESHRHINPYGIVAVGPDLNFDLPHDRATRFS